VESLFSIPASPIQSSIPLTQPTNVAHTSAATADYSEEVEGQRAIHKLNVQELGMRRQQKINTKFAESLQDQKESYRKEATAALRQQRESDKKWAYAALQQQREFDREGAKAVISQMRRSAHEEVVRYRRQNLRDVCDIRNWHEQLHREPLGQTNEALRREADAKQREEEANKSEEEAQQENIIFKSEEKATTKN